MADIPPLTKFKINREAWPYEAGMGHLVYGGTDTLLIAKEVMFVRLQRRGVLEFQVFSQQNACVHTGFKITQEEANDLLSSGFFHQKVIPSSVELAEALLNFRLRG